MRRSQRQGVMCEEKVTFLHTQKVRLCLRTNSRVGGEGRHLFCLKILSFVLFIYLFLGVFQKHGRRLLHVALQEGFCEISQMTKNTTGF